MKVHGVQDDHGSVFLNVLSFGLMQQIEIFWFFKYWPQEYFDVMQDKLSNPLACEVIVQLSCMHWDMVVELFPETPSKRSSSSWDPMDNVCGHAQFVRHPLLFQATNLENILNVRSSSCICKFLCVCVFQYTETQSFNSWPNCRFFYSLTKSVVLVMFCKMSAFHKMFSLACQSHLILGLTCQSYKCNCPVNKLWISD